MAAIFLSEDALLIEMNAGRKKKVGTRRNL
jgi:hypothetical protein